MARGHWALTSMSSCQPFCHAETKGATTYKAGAPDHCVIALPCVVWSSSKAKAMTL